jgi:hypothetical protein
MNRLTIELINAILMTKGLPKAVRTALESLEAKLMTMTPRMGGEVSPQASKRLIAAFLEEVNEIATVKAVEEKPQDEPTHIEVEHNDSVEMNGS